MVTKLLRHTFLLLISTLFFTFVCPTYANDAEIGKALQLKINDFRSKFNALKIGKARNYKIDNFCIDRKKSEVQLSLSKNFEFIEYREEIIRELHDSLRACLPEDIKDYKFEIYINSLPLEYYVPNIYRSDLKIDKERKPNYGPSESSIVINKDKPFVPKKGLANSHIALWHSHGWYFDPVQGTWQWQRPKLFQITEDTYSMSIVLPYLVPMLENAGAYVFTPRERDMQRFEVVVDNNDNLPESYLEKNDSKFNWNESEDSTGFANSKFLYTDFDNPFKTGTYRTIKSRKHGDAYIDWTPEIPASGDYAVYVSYHTLPESTTEAHYTVHHTGGTTEFVVDQTMGGGTWIYLGTFNFERGSSSNKVRLTNASKAGGVITADAVKFGGGMGNIGKTSVSNDGDTITAASGRARYLEGAKYWLQWAGYPDSVYSVFKGTNDYKDDYMCRGLWVNNLLGGSDRAPLRKGKNIPIDLAFALHTDAGFTLDSTTIGTMGIYMTNVNDSKFASGYNRYASRDFSDIVQTQLVDDIREQYCADWNRRRLTNESYHEARTPEVPTLLLEFLSHQNYDDMKFGLDPNFRFSVARSIYKGMLKFLASQYDVEYEVQPLPVRNFSAEIIDSTESSMVALSWSAQADSLEESAYPKKYIVYKAVENNGFDNGTVTNVPYIVLPIGNDTIYRFKVTAVNDGGESFPSEILSVCNLSESKGLLLIVNGFDRVSAPEHFRVAKHSGFLDRLDYGVPDKYDVSYTGSQYNFVIGSTFATNNAPGHGASSGEFETDIIAGNTFDFPYKHGRSIKKAGYSFASCSDEFFESEQIDLDKYFAIDYILGEEKETISGKAVKYQVFSENMISKLKDYLLKHNGNLLLTGAYIGSEIWEKDSCDMNKIDFAENVLHYTFVKTDASNNGKLTLLTNSDFNSEFNFCTKLNQSLYAVEAPDAINCTKGGKVQFRFSDSKLPACVTYRGTYKSVVATFPFESILYESNRNKFMSETLSFFENNERKVKKRTVAAKSSPKKKSVAKKKKKNKTVKKRKVSPR